MKKSLLSVTVVAVLLAGIGFATAQTTTTTTTWTNEQGAALTTYSTTQKYMSFKDMALVPNVGMALPTTVTVYPLPSTVTVAKPEMYSYGIVNDRNVIIDRTTRKVVHVW